MSERRDFNEEDVKSLKESITRIGLLNPITVRKVDGKYILVSGRYRITKGGDQNVR